MSLHSSPRSPAPAIPASPPPPSPPKATQQQGNGTAAPPVAGEEKDPPQPVHESPFAAHGAEGWDLGEEQGWELPPEGESAPSDAVTLVLSHKSYLVSLPHHRTTGDPEPSHTFGQHACFGGID